MTDEQDVDKSAEAELQVESAQEEQAAGSADDSAEVSAGTADAEAPAGDEPDEQQLSSEEEQQSFEEKQLGSEEEGDAMPDSAGSDEFGDEKSPEMIAREEAEKDAEVAMLSMLEGLPEEKQGAMPDDINFGTASVSNAEFQQLQQPAGEQQPRNIDLLMDIDLPISIELGRTKMSIADILALGPGSVVELSKLAGEPVDLLINQKIVARGEVVVVDENFGLRITQLMTPEERLKALANE